MNNNAALPNLWLSNMGPHLKGDFPIRQNKGHNAVSAVLFCLLIWSLISVTEVSFKNGLLKCFFS